MTSIAKAMIPLSNVCVLVAFVIVIYAVIGLQMLSGLYHYTCFNTGANGEITHDLLFKTCKDFLGS